MPLPRSAPWRSIASRAYWEQVGTKRQDGGNHGEITAWYNFKSEIRMTPIGLTFAKASSEFRRQGGASLIPPKGVTPNQSAVAATLCRRAP
jgi:hypothetical protein